VLAFTSETAKLARAKHAPRPVFDRKAWLRRWWSRERARRLAVGVCYRCGFALVEKFKSCNGCRRKQSKSKDKKVKRAL
jgi:hypothetical protein